MKENAWLSYSRGAGKAELEALWRDATRHSWTRERPSGSVRRQAIRLATCSRAMQSLEEVQADR